MKFPIVLYEGEKGYKVTTILFLSDGGFAVIIPHHKEGKAVIFKAPVVYRKPPDLFELPIDSLILNYQASEKPKLSIHQDGFCQFSSDRQGTIRSGKDPLTGIPRGIGIQIPPLSNPISSGPTFAIQVWGLPDYKDWSRKKGDEFALKFHKFYTRKSTGQKDSYLIEGYLFPTKKVKPYIFTMNGKYYFDIVHHNFEDYKQITFRYSALPLFDRSYVIGILVSRSKVNFNIFSGFSLSGPSQIIGYDSYGNPIGHSLQAIYPINGEIELPTESIDYKKQESSQ